MKSWFRFDNAANDPSTVDIHIIDFIGGWIDDMLNRLFNEEIGITARAFVEQLAALPDAVKTINVHINSPGGDVQGGINIANALRQQTTQGRTVNTYIDGIAASIASVIAMAGQKVYIADNALVMIHDPWMVAVGDEAEFTKALEILETVKGQTIATYQWHSKLPAEQIAKLMTAETWMDADEAIAKGFATDKVQGLKAAASITRASLKALKVPDQHRARVEAFCQPAAVQPAPAPAAEVTRLCAEAGAPSAFIADLVAANLPIDQAKARIAADKATRDAEAQQARQDREAAEARESAIRGACAVAKAPEFADTLVKSGMSVADVKAHLVVLKARLDAVTVDGSLHPDQPTGGKRTVDRAAAYRNFSQQPSA